MPVHAHQSPDIVFQCAHAFTAFVNLLAMTPFPGCRDDFAGVPDFDDLGARHWVERLSVRPA